MPEGQSDQELAADLVKRQEHCRTLELGIAEAEQALKVSKMYVKEWQAKYAALLESINKPRKNQKPVLFRVVVRGAQIKFVTDPMPLLEALNKLLSRPDVGDCGLWPVFEGAVEKQGFADDIGEGGELVH